MAERKDYQTEVCMYDSPVIWYSSCLGLILTPTPAPLCLLLQTHAGKCLFSVFFILSIISLHTVFFFFFLNLSRLPSLWLWHVLTWLIDIDCQADMLMLHIPSWGELALRLAVWARFLFVASKGATTGYPHSWVCVCGRMLSVLSFAFANKHFCTNGRYENNLFVNRAIIVLEKNNKVLISKSNSN